ncbi:cobalt/nickel transport system permease protein [Selenomonas sp. GACV-9]|uniref:energy-coupling factor transporter transmembrane component T n=1 Tax=Selenomonas sp. GACV-9 TaxID=3158782 RepID=UPI0008EFD5E4|nr:cobalt/nickel transport system permease protein [Selenomonas ruminantium]
MIKLPPWAIQEENYQPNRDRDYFISRSLLRVMTVLLAIRQQAGHSLPRYISASSALCFLFFWLLLCVTAHTSAFLLCELALTLVLLCLLPGRMLWPAVQASLAAAFFSLLLILPAIALGSGALVLLLPAKTFLSVAALSILRSLLPWNELTAALRRFHVPQTVIFLLDTTLRYIILLGEIARDMLTALKLRSIGKNRHKQRAAGGILGTMFLRSKEMSETMYEAMICRGFTGEYLPARQQSFRPGDNLLLLIHLLYLYLFLRLEAIL